MPRFSLVLFDLDGTLVDTAEDIAGALNAALTEAGFPEQPTSQVTSYIGNGVARLIERALASDQPTPAAVDTLVRRFKAHYAAHVCDRSRVYPGVTELLDRLASPGVSLAVLTNKPGDLARELLKALGIAGRFGHVVGDGDGFARKPAADAALWLMAQHRVSSASTLLVGDGLPDVQVARAARCPVAAVTWGYTSRAALMAERPTFVVDEPLAVARLAAG